MVLLADSLATLINQHAVQPGARVVQAAILLLTMFSAMHAVGSTHGDHWTHALIRPVGVGVSGIAAVEVFRAAAGAVIAGTIGF